MYVFKETTVCNRGAVVITRVVSWLFNDGRLSNDSGVSKSLCSSEARNL